MIRPKCLRAKIVLDIDKSSGGFQISSAAMLEILSDGRTISRFTEEWICVTFGYQRPGGDTPGFDLVQESTGCRFSVKSLTHRGTAVRFSRNTGVGRHCTPEDVLRAISGPEAFIFADNTNLPMVTFIQIPQKVLLDWFRKGVISQNNGHISYANFCGAVNCLPIQDVKNAHDVEKVQG